MKLWTLPHFLKSSQPSISNIVLYIYNLKMSLPCINLPNPEGKLIHQKGNLMQYQAKPNT